MVDNGFYLLESLNSTYKLQKFFNAAKERSFKQFSEIKDDHYMRVKNDNLTVDDYINNYLNSKTHNVAVDRFKQSNYSINDCKYGEISSCTMNLNNDLFISLYLDLDAFYSLLNEFKII